ncbi:LysR substrate-binding domain-containing protein [Sinorhizobium sp. RAC02]|uniref:LysR substrate-binding domain-containing protein n=1 Tax=Sinorhizobium sp. RAC02 TaxID=1842534 RepID=UPI00083DF647|nr:LysR substrate-binding domain-containing protein [Sinorhizobium sp. RAC02]AOF93053.1 bacterial regulatory helix-turn-helix, lysR family protein [Sinorhizobium sp. RAC02]
MASAHLPLNWLRAFESAGRLGTFAGAGVELNVTPSAVSQHIRALEGRLGKELFTRHANGVRLTVPGRRYAEELGLAFAAIDEASRRFAGHGTREMLVVHVPTSFASQWIAPRLDLFRARQPEIDLRLTALDHGEDKVDATIAFGLGNWPKHQAMLLLRDEAFPVCGPKYAEALACPQDLKGHDLLHVPGYAEDWDTWLTHAGVKGIDTSSGSFFDQSIMAIRAAVEGKGVLLGRAALIERELSSGLLVEPFGVRLPAAGSYWFLTSGPKENLPKVAAFRDWLSEMTAA